METAAVDVPYPISPGPEMAALQRFFQAPLARRTPTGAEADAPPLARRPPLVSDRALPAAVAGVDLYWLPLGAGGHSVRLNGRVFEAIAARLERRTARDLYHSALEVRVSAGRFVIEMTPIPDANGARRGAVAEGAVGSRWAGRLRIGRAGKPQPIQRTRG